MGFVALVLLISISFLIYLNRRRDRYSLTKTILFVLFTSLIVNVSLYHNYIQSLVPGLYDGIGISNVIAYQFFPDHSWSFGFFKKRYDQSILVSVVLLIALIGMYFIERFKGENTQGH